MDGLKRWRKNILLKLLGIDTATQPRLIAFVITTLRLIYGVGRELLEGQMTLRAMSLVYTTLLSLVPLLAFSFSVLKAFDVHNQLQPALHQFLAPLGEKGVELSTRVVGFVENIKVGVLGSLGLLFLIIIVISLMYKIEAAFNYIWGVSRPRRMARRFSDYMSVILVGPVLVFSALGITATIMGSEFMLRVVEIKPFGSVLQALTRIIPYVLMWAAFTFVYIFIPNTKVQMKSALIGGLIAALLWETTGMLFAAFIVSSTNYQLIYSGFAILVLFMLWLYWGWMILLMGAQAAFFYQYPEFLRARSRRFMLSNLTREGVALSIMFLIGHSHFYNKPRWDIESLAHRLGLPMSAVQRTANKLQKKGYIIETQDEPPSYVPARDIGSITLLNIYEDARRNEEDLVEQLMPWVPKVAEVSQQVETAIAQALAGQTLKDIVVAQGDDPGLTHALANNAGI